MTHSDTKAFGRRGSFLIISRDGSVTKPSSNALLRNIQDYNMRPQCGLQIVPDGNFQEIMRRFTFDAPLPKTPIAPEPA